MTSEQNPHIAVLERLISLKAAQDAGRSLDTGALALAMWLVDSQRAEGQIWAQVRFDQDEQGAVSMHCLHVHYTQNPGGASVHWTRHGGFQYEDDALEKSGLPSDRFADVSLRVDPSNIAAFLRETGAPEISNVLLAELLQSAKIRRPHGALVIDRLVAGAGAPADLSKPPFKDAAFLLAVLDGAGTPKFRELVVQQALENIWVMKVAAANGRSDLVEELLKRGFPVDSVGRDYGSSSASNLLHAAGGSEEVMRQLLNSGLDPRSKNADGATPLHTAAHPEVMRLLLDRGVLVHEEDAKGRIALHYALREVNGGREVDPRCLNVLLDAGADPFYRSQTAAPEYLSPFEMAVKKGLLRHAKCITERCPVDFAQRTLGGKTLIQLAGTSASMKALLRAAKADASIRRSVQSGVEEHPESPRPARAFNAGAL